MKSLFGEKRVWIIESVPFSPITFVKSFAIFHNKSRHIISCDGEDFPVSQVHFSLFSVSKFNPQNIFSQSQRLTYKEPQVSCEMGQKSTHLT